MVTLDRIEGEVAVLLKGEKSLTIPAKLLSPYCKEGDVVEQQADGLWVPNAEQTHKQRQKTRHLLSQLYHKK